MENVYTRSIMSMIFTTTGELVVVHNEENELDTMPQCFFGRKEEGARRRRGKEIRVLNNEIDYKSEVAYFFSELDSNQPNFALETEWLTPNINTILDCGELHESVAKFQIEEIANLECPSFIRISQNTYDGGTLENGIQVMNDISVRYITMSKFTNMKYYEQCEVISIEKLLEKMNDPEIKTSDNLRWFMTGEELENIKRFSKQLQEFTQKDNTSFHLK